ncbi:MAG TPA: SRPBCC family protein [Candidatus Binatia bacterium]|nr:SRPBCC family protein [Candidatus Binatia bacterium]
MKTYEFKTNLWLPQSRAKVFEFFSNPGNLDRLTPAWLKFEILTPATIQMNKGTLLDYRLRIRGIPIRWQSEITAWDPPYRFVDQQIKGPYSLWIHEHAFAQQDGGTLVGDRVEYAVPGGAIVQKLLVAPDLERIFRYRHKVLEEIFNPTTLSPTEQLAV